MSTFYEGWTEVVPGPDETPQAVAELLTRYAGKTQAHVRTLRGGTSFLVHPDVARKYNSGRSRRSKTQKGDDA